METGNSGDEKKLGVLLKLARLAPMAWAAALTKNTKLAKLRDWLVASTPKLGPEYNYATRLYWLAHGLSDFPVCQYCGEKKLERNVDSLEKGWTRACSAQCPGMKSARVAKIRKTCLEKYGAANWFASEAGREAQAKYLEANGVENAFQLESVKEKSKATMLAKTGYAHAMQNPATRQLVSDKRFTETGYVHHFADPEVIAKARATKAANREAAAQSGEDPSATTKLANRDKRYSKFEASETKPLFTRAEFEKLSAMEQYSVELTWRCAKCGKEFKSPVDQNFSSRNGQPARCPDCYPPMAGDSAAERELADFISQYAEAIRRDRKAVGQELDVYVPSRKLAFEYDGLYWHSVARERKRSAKLAKTKACEKAGIQLIHVFENEWLNKRAVVESRIRNLLGSWDKNVFARKCEIVEVGAAESAKFQDQNHLQGAVRSKVNLGLHYGGELCALMTFSRCRFDRKHEWELVRFCPKLGYHVVGGAGKLLKAFERQWKPKSIVTYADRRWSQGKLYTALGFTYLHSAAPNYWYFKSADKLWSRVVFQKHKLAKLIGDVFDPAKTEVANMEAAGWNRIFDCGNLVYEKVLG